MDFVCIAPTYLHLKKSSFFLYCRMWRATIPTPTMHGFSPRLTKIRTPQWVTLTGASEGKNPLYLKRSLRPRPRAFVDHIIAMAVEVSA